MKRLKNKIVWLSGASTGIGRALADTLVESGTRLIVSGRKLEEMQKIPGIALALSCDVRNPEQWRQCATAIEQQFGCVDCFIYNSGICEYCDVKNFDAQSVIYNTEVNYLGLVRGVEVALPLLRRSNDPHIVGMSSSVAWFGLPRAEGYGASKAAISYFLRSLRIDLAAEGIDVSIILPGFVKTPLTDKNDFPMPFLIDVDVAARGIMRGIEKRSFEIHLPRRFTCWLKFFAHLPPKIQHFIGRSFVKQ